MSSSNANTADPLPSTSPNTPYSQAAQWIGISQAHQAVMLDDRAKLLAAERRTVAHHRLATLGLPPQDEKEEMIHIGDVNTHTHTAPPAVTGALGPLAKLAIGAALAAGTGGAGLGLWAALRPAAEKVVQQILPGTNTRESVTAGDTIVE